MNAADLVSSFEYVMLDFDGVVADTESVFDRYDGEILNVFLETSGIHGRLNRSEVRELAGIPFEEKLELAAQRFGLEADPLLAEEFCARRKEGRRYLFRDERVVISSGLIELMDRKQGRTALVTNKDIEKLEWDLDALNLHNLFSIKVTLSPPFRRKPAPDLLLEAMRRLNADPRKCCYIGDNELDMQAALAARVTPLGFIVEGIYNRPGRADELLKAGAAAVFDDFSSLL